MEVLGIGLDIGIIIANVWIIWWLWNAKQRK